MPELSSAPPITIIDAVHDQNLFGGWFRDPETWKPWFTFLKVLFGLPITEDERRLFEQCTGRAVSPAGGVREAWLVCGRRAGKSFVLALVAVFLACFHDWSRVLAKADTGTIVIIAADRRQARVIYRYVTALLRGIPLLAGMIARDTAEQIDLVNGITLEIMAASFRTVRGYTLVAALCDEIAFWRSDESGANPDTEIISALRPAMATVPGAMLLCASSPYARRGALWTTFRKHFGHDSRVLVWRAPTLVMNATVPEDIVASAYEDDAANAAAEYGGEFRVDVETFVSKEVIDAATMVGRIELPPMGGASYVAFCDPSGGSSDSMTVAVAHRGKDGAAVLDVIRERTPPFSPDNTVREFAGGAQILRDHPGAG